MIHGRMPVQTLILHNVARRQLWIGRSQFIEGHGRMQQWRPIECVNVVAEAVLSDDGVRPNMADGKKVIAEEVGSDQQR